MHTYSLSQLADHVLLRDLATILKQDRVTTATLLAHLAEVDTRKLYLPAGYPSMYLYCVGELKLSEDSAAKRIQAARTARQFPAIFPALAEGRLHLSAVVLLAAHLTPGTAEELLAAAEHKTSAEIKTAAGRTLPAARPADARRGALVIGCERPTGRAASFRTCQPTCPGAG